MKEDKIRVIISTGIGPLHLLKTASSLVSFVNIKVIQSWVPKNTDSKLVKVFSKLVGHNSLNITLKKRSPTELIGNIYSCPKSDFIFRGLLLFAKVFKFPSRKWSAGVAWTIYGKESKKFINDEDIFHVRSGAGQGGAILKAKQEGMKIIVDHSIAHPRFMEKQLKDEYLRNNVPFNLGMDAPLFKNTVLDAELADILLVNSNFVKQTFVDEGINPEKIKVNYLGVREDFFGLKKKYEIVGVPKLLFTGSFSFRKGAEYLFQALQILESKGFEYKMNIVGACNSIDNLVKKYPLKNLNFVGFVPQDQLKHYLSESDLYVFPSLCEGCASSGMEAMAAGLPIITTLESGLPIIHMDNGFIVTSKNSIELAKNIMSILSDFDLRNRIGNAAKDSIRSNFTWEKYSTNLNAIYNDLLN